MNGIYIHIPFCKKACHYCDFHFSTNVSRQQEMVDAIIQELNLRVNYLNSNEISSIYFGGGTPSLLSAHQLNQIMEAVRGHFSFAENIEITLEANPDDINQENLSTFISAGVNRLSLGVQSFHEPILKWMNRAHDQKQAENALNLINASAINNYSVDLIHGIPISNEHLLAEDLDKLISFQPKHISAYCLTIEPDTVFGNLQSKGKFVGISEEKAAQQFLQVKETLEKVNYHQYEVSNYSQAGYESFHNTNYWNRVNYLGLGPGAHSFNGNSRQYNIANNALYMKSISQNELATTIETLSRNDKINEYLMTSLRTIKGLSLTVLKKEYGLDILDTYAEEIARLQKANYLVLTTDQRIKLTTEGLLIADQIAAELFLVD